jgi:SagB-type dehydrogenase family enzyme
MPTPEDYRKFMKSDLWLEFRGLPTDQQRRLPNPPIQKPYAASLPQVALVPPDRIQVGTRSVREAIARRVSHRTYTDAPLSLEELSYLTWATQGVHEIWRGGIALRRTVPSAGARHPFETYLVINRVEGLDVGLYRYLSIEHALLQLRADPALPEQIAAACHEQPFIARSAVTFVWAALPYRTEWRYSLMAPKLVNLDAGHVCQSLYLAAESIDAGVCAVAAYSQKDVDTLLGLDGEDEFAIYVAPVGKV